MRLGRLMASTSRLVSNQPGFTGTWLRDGSGVIMESSDSPPTQYDAFNRNTFSGRTAKRLR